MEANQPKFKVGDRAYFYVDQVEIVDIHRSGSGKIYYSCVTALYTPVITKEDCLFLLPTPKDVAEKTKEETDMTKFTEEDIAKDKSIDEKFERMGMADFNPLDHNIVVAKWDMVNNKENPFDAIIAEIQQLHENKNADYGDSFAKSVEKYGLISALTRISDKFNRAEQLILGNEAKVKDEKLRDTLIDLASYAIMTIVELDKQKNG